MYNRYIPDDEGQAWVRTETEHASGPVPRQETRSNSALSALFSGREGLSSLFSGRDGAGLSGLLKALHLEDIDSGDVLLLLIMLYLLIEGDELELVIALGLVLIMGLGEDKK